MVWFKSLREVLDARRETLVDAQTGGGFADEAAVGFLIQVSELADEIAFGLPMLSLEQLVEPGHGAASAYVS